MTSPRRTLAKALTEWPPLPERRRARGTGSVYYHVASRSWAAQRPRWLDPKRTVSYHDTEAEAHAALDAILDAAHHHRTADPMAEPFGAFLHRWLAAQKTRRLSERTLELYAVYLRWVSVEIGRIAVGALSADHINTILATMDAAGLSAGYINEVRSTLKRAVRDCYRWAEASKPNPVDLSVALAVVRPERQCWSEAEARRVLELSRDDPYGVAWRIALDVGLRAGELRGLVWADYDRERRLLRVTEQTDERRVRRATKTKKTRTVRLTTATCQQLDRHKERQARILAESKTKPAWAVRRYVRHIKLGPSDPILLGLRSDGGVSPRALRQQFDRLIEQAAVKPITLHDLRHTAASIMLRRRVPLPLVARILGHSSPVITARVYAHVIDEMETEAVEAMEAVFPPD